MSTDHDEKIGRIAEILASRIARGGSLEVDALADEYEVSRDEVADCAAAMQTIHASLDEDLSTGDRIRPPSLPDDYEIRDELGRGGMGIVYRAHQQSLDRDVAVKVLRPGDLIFGDAIQRFEREARSLARLRHRHIVSVHEVGNVDGFVYFTMDLVEGRTLGELIEERAITTTQAVRLLRQVASAIAYAHSRGVVHRDLKPANILVDNTGDAFVVDFGLARDLSAVAPNTLSGQLIGTPTYMSPEQALGDTARIGEPADIYALGVVLYECLAGRAPFADLPLAKLMQAVIEEAPPPLRRQNPKVPGDLQVICEKAMAKQPEQRYATVQAFAEDLERFASGRAIEARPPSKVYRLRQFAAKHRRKVTTWLAAALVLVVVGWQFVFPPMLREYQLGLAERLLAGGSDLGAMHAYRAAFEGVNPGELGYELETRFARLLIDEAGRLHWDRGPAAKDEYQALLTEAETVLPPPEYGPHKRPLDHLRDWEFEKHRLRILRSGRRGLPSFTYLDGNDCRQREQDGFVDPKRRPSFLLLLASSQRGPERQELGELESRALLEILTNRHRLPTGTRAQFELAVGAEHRDLPFSPLLAMTRGLEKELAAIVADRSCDRETRELATALFHTRASFPVCVFRRKHVHDSGLCHVVVPQARDFELIERGMRELEGLERWQAYRKRVELAAEAFFAVREAPENVRARVTGWDIQHWIYQQTGFRVSRSLPEQWQTWWKKHGAEDPRRWLLRALKWDIEPEQLTVDLLLQRMRQANQSQRGVAPTWVHKLLILTAPADIIERPRRPDIVAWQRALGKIPDVSVRLRVLVMGLRGGDPEPILAARHRFELRIGDKETWRDQTAPPAALSSLYVDLGQSRAPYYGKLISAGHAQAVWTEAGVAVRAGSQAQVPTQDQTGSSDWGSDATVPMGEVRLIGWQTKHSLGGRHDMTWLALATVELSDDPAIDRPWAWWKARLIETIRSCDPSQINDTRAVSEPGMFLSLAGSEDGLMAIAKAAARITDIADFRVSPRRALLMAGDERALALEPGKHRSDREWNRNDYWCRLAVSTKSEKIRAHAYEQLEGAELSPPLLRMLAGLTDLPSVLATQVANAPGPAWAFISLHLGTLLFLGVLHALALYGLVGLLRPKRRLHALLLFVAVFFIRRSTVQVGDVLWMPQWLAAGLGVIAFWLVFWRLSSFRTWWLIPLIWTAAECVHAYAPIHDLLPSAALIATIIAVISRRQHRCQPTAVARV
ncbi:MAG: serine/threonine protein kinase [bacterium]|nr:serine/threonine protein kinase [bacterium]